MSAWLKYCIARDIVKYHNAFSSCKQFVKHPEVRFSKKMGQKSKVTVLALDLEDPATTEGMIRVCKKYVPYVPSHPSGHKQKTVVFGDQGFYEKGNTFQWSSTSTLKHHRVSCFLVIEFREE